MPGSDSALVIDADIARSAGNSPGIAYICTELLNATRTGDHHVRLCPVMDYEWSKHMSAFARTWYLAMRHAQRLVTEPVEECPNLSKAIQTVKMPSKRKAIEKDRHLIDAAHCGGCRVLSRDQKARRWFAALHPHCEKLEAIYWAIVDESAYGTQAIAWVNAGAPQDAAFALIPTITTTSVK